MKGQRNRKRRAHVAYHTRKQAKQRAVVRAKQRRVDMIVNRAQARSNRQRRTFALPVAIPKPRTLDMTRWLEERRKAG